MKTCLSFILMIILLITVPRAGCSSLDPSKRLVYVDGSICFLTSSASDCAKDFFYNTFGEMNEANCLNCDRYFHCRANFNTAQFCYNGYQDAKILSDCRDPPSATDPDSVADREANEFGRNGGDCASRYLCNVRCAYNPFTKSCLKSNCP